MAELGAQAAWRSSDSDLRSPPRWRSWIDHSGEVVWEPAPSLIAQLIEAGQPFWLDIENPTDEIIDQLAIRLGLHPLAVEDSKQFGQRAKLQVYGNGAMLVGFGLDKQLRDPSKCTATTPPDS